MNEFVRVLIGALTLGISEIVRVAQENKKCEWDYTYKPKGKAGCCKWRNRCPLWNKCLDNIETCKKVHAENQPACKE